MYRRLASLSFLLVVAFAMGLAYSAVQAQTSEASLETIADTYVQSDRKEPKGLERFLEVRFTRDAFLSYSLLKFDLGGKIPPNVKIVSMKLTLFVQRTSSPLTVGTFFSQNAAWNETTLVWDSAGVLLQNDQEPSDWKLISGAGEQSRRDFDLSAYTKELPKSMNFTVVLKPYLPQASPSVGVVQFFSKESPETQFAPKLTVAYEQVTETTATTGQTSRTSATSQATSGYDFVAPSTSLTLPLAGGAAAAIALFAFLLLAKRRRGTTAPSEPERMQTQPPPYATVQYAETAEVALVPTGTRSIDRALNGGLPLASSAILLSSLADDTDLALTNMITRACESGIKTLYFTTRERAAIAALLDKYENFAVVICHQSAGTLYVGKRRVFRAALSLTQTDIARAQAEKELNLYEDAAPKVAAIDILSSLLVENNAKSVRFWLVDMLQKLKTLNFVVLASLNPRMHREDEVAIITDLFAGEIETVGKERVEGRERYVIVKRFLDHQYDSRPTRFP